MRTLIFLGWLALLPGCVDEPSGPAGPAVGTPRARVLFDWTILPGTSTKLMDSNSSDQITGISPDGNYAVGSYSNEGLTGFLIRLADNDWGSLEEVSGSLDHNPQAINDFGMVAGYVSESGVFWADDDAPPIILPPLPGDVGSAAYALTNEASPTVVGISYSGGATRAVKWVLTGPAYNTPTPVLLSSPGTTYSTANAVNAAANTIVGKVVKSSGGAMAVRWDLSTGAMEELDVVGSAEDVNSSGVVVGATNEGAGFIKDGAALTLRAGAPLRAINDNGLVVGTTGSQSFVWSGMADDAPVYYWPPGSFLQTDFLDISNNEKVAAMSFGTLPFNPVLPLSNLWILDFNVIPDDGDDDAISASSDNCPNRANADQADGDSDGVGDLCDPDSPPVALLSVSRTSVLEGSAVRFSTSAFDPGGRALFYSWTFPDGAVVPNAVVTRAVGNPGTFTATASVTNQAGGVTTNDTDVTVVNRVPAVRFGIRNQTGEAPAVGRSGAVTSIDIFADDAGPSEELNVLVIWDRNVTTSHTCTTPCSFSRDHTYFVPGQHTITVKVTDANGRIRRASQPFAVLWRALTLDVWPGNARTSIDLDDPLDAVIRIAVLGSATFDVTTLLNTVTLSDGTGSPVNKLGALAPADVNGDTYPDRVFRFRRSSLLAAGNLDINASALILNGRLVDGAYVQGITTISVAQ